jgi:hypothetical protein
MSMEQMNPPSLKLLRDEGNRRLVCGAKSSLLDGGMTLN